MLILEKEIKNYMDSGLLTQPDIKVIKQFMIDDESFQGTLEGGLIGFFERLQVISSQNPRLKNMYFTLGDLFSSKFTSIKLKGKRPKDIKK